ncbi:MAG: hypothetical protein ACKPCI_06070 [Dolichospermum sp.]
MTLKDDIEQFRRHLNRCLETTEYFYRLCNKIQDCPEDDLSYFFRQLQELCEELEGQLRHTGDCLMDINRQWGNASIQHYQSRIGNITNISGNTSSVNSNSVPVSSGAKFNFPAVNSIYETQLDPDFGTLLKTLMSAQDKFQIFKTRSIAQGIKIAKGKIGESLCHAFLPEIIDSCWFLEGQKGLTVETTTEELAYQTAKEFLAKNSSIKYAIASRPFSGGDRCAVDSAFMVISRQDIENWEQLKRSSATYLVFECKTDSSRLSESQSLSSYVEKQAKYMENNTLGLEDRHQLGKDLLQASSEGRVIYTDWHLDTPSGKIKARRIL